MHYSLEDEIVKNYFLHENPVEVRSFDGTVIVFYREADDDCYGQVLVGGAGGQADRPGRCHKEGGCRKATEGEQAVFSGCFFPAVSLNFRLSF